MGKKDALQWEIRRIFLKQTKDFNKHKLKVHEKDSDPCLTFTGSHHTYASAFSSPSPCHLLHVHNSPRQPSGL